VAVLDAADSGRSLPWPALARKLAPGALVVSLSPFLTGLARHAQVLAPAPAPLESWDEVLPTVDSSAASYGLAAPLLAAPGGATEPVEFVRRLAGAVGARLPAGSLEDRLRRRVAAIHACGRGKAWAPVEGGFRAESVDTPDALFQLLAKGGGWLDDERRSPLRVAPPLPSAAALRSGSELGPAELALLPFAARGTAGTTPVSPLMSKLYQETALRPSTETAMVSPDTGRALGLAEASRVRLRSSAGEVEAELRYDATLPPGRVTLAAGPDPAGLHADRGSPAAGALALATPEPDLTWRRTVVEVREA
jgi:anaerobic selenocysteine-containing dehydrogenase